jgi:hypothetical protein
MTVEALVGLGERWTQTASLEHVYLVRSYAARMEAEFRGPGRVSYCKTGLDMFM